MKRRSFLAGAATATFGNTSLAQPAVVAKAKTLIHVPQANLTSLDPVWTTALVTRNYAAMVFETLRLPVLDHRAAHRIMSATAASILVRAALFVDYGSVCLPLPAAHPSQTLFA